MQIPMSSLSRRSVYDGQSPVHEAIVWKPTAYPLLGVEYFWTVQLLKIHLLVGASCRIPPRKGVDPSLQ